MSSIEFQQVLYASSSVGDVVICNVEIAALGYCSWIL